MTCPGTAAVLLPRFHRATFGPPPAVESTLAELAAGQLFVLPSEASSLKTYSPRPSVVHEKVNVAPVAPDRTVALAGLGLPHVDGPPIAVIAPGETPVMVVEALLTVSETVTGVPEVTTLLLTAIAVVSPAPSLPSTAAMGE